MDSSTHKAIQSMVILNAMHEEMQLSLSLTAGLLNISITLEDLIGLHSLQVEILLLMLCFISSLLLNFLFIFYKRLLLL